MASLLSKIQTLISADLNRLVDRSLDANDPAIFQQHIRELQKMQGQLTDQMVALRAQITAMRRKSDEQQALVVKQDLEVDQLLQTGLQADALAAQERLNQNRLVAGRAAEKVERLEEEYSQAGRDQGAARRSYPGSAPERARGRGSGQREAGSKTGRLSGGNVGRSLRHGRRGCGPRRGFHPQPAGGGGVAAFRA